MVISYQEGVDLLRDNIGSASNAYNNALNQHSWETWYYSGSNDLERIVLSVKIITQNMLTYMSFMMGWEVVQPGGDYIVPWLFENIEASESYELTWEKIVNVWILSPLDGQQWTIGMIDYMRKVIWDKPYNFPLIPSEIGG